MHTRLLTYGAFLMVLLLGGEVYSSIPPRETKVQEYNNVSYRISNFGVFANSFDDSSPDTFTTLMFPRGSRFRYGWLGSLWVGAVADTDTICHVGFFESCGRGSGYTQWDFDPDTMPYGDTIIVSDYPNYQLTSAHYTDTLHQYWIPEADPRNPLYISVRQLTYAFTDPEFEDFIILRFLIKNAGPRNLTDVYLGLWNDAEAFRLGSTADFGSDDITGFLKWYYISPTESVRVDLAWVSDNDGDPSGGVFDSLSVTGVNAFKVLYTAGDSLRSSYNWWCMYDTNDFSGIKKDWGP